MWETTKFVFILVFTMPSTCYFFMRIQDSDWFHIPFASRISSNISCSASLLVINYINFCLSEKKIFTYPSVFKDMFSWAWHSGFIFFLPFRTFKVGPHRVLACIVSAEKSVVILVSILLYIMCPFSLPTLKVFSLSSVLTFLYPNESQNELVVF